MTTRAACSTLHIETTRPKDPLNGSRSTGLRMDLQRFIKFLKGTIGGETSASDRRTVYKGTQRATGTITIASSDTGTYGNTINGVTVNATGITDDQHTALAIANALNASTDPLVQNYIDASNDSATIALASVLPGSSITICGYTLNAIATAAGATGSNEFLVGTGNNTTDATALKNCINNLEGLRELVFATSSSATVTVHSIRPASELFDKAVLSAQNTFTITAFASSKVVLVTARRKGLFGNAITLAVTGTGSTASGARLTGGTEATAVTY